MCEIARGLKRGVHRGAGLTFTTFDLYHRVRGLWANRAMWRCPPVLVFQMGKVGSMSVAQALEGAGVGRPVIHLHELSPSGIERFHRASRVGYDLQRDVSSRVPREVESAIIMSNRSRAVESYLRHRRWAGRPDVVTLVRDPVAQVASDYFHHLDRTDPALARLIRDRPSSLEAVGRAHRAVVDQVACIEPLRWFDDELARVFDIDVFAQPFDVAAGFRCYTSAEAGALLIRYEDLERVFPAAIETFLGVDGVELPRRNMAVGKYYGPTYDAAIQAIELSQEQLERIYGSSHVQHFYSAPEIDAFVERWS